MASRYGMTNAEANAHAAKFKEPCPKCGSRRTCVVGYSFGGYKSCHDCSKEWGWTDARGSNVSRAKYQERAEADRAEWRSKSARSWRMNAPAGEETDMAKKLAKKKGAKGAKGAKAKSKASKKAAKKNTVSKKASTATPEDRAQKSAMGYACALIVTSKLDDMAICKAVLKKFPKAATMYQNGTAPSRIRQDMKNHKERYAWTNGLKRS